MASVNQLVSEIAHSVQGADNIAVRRGIKLAIIHARNEIIRHSFEQHSYVDKVLKQRFKLSLIDAPDGDLNGTQDFVKNKVKRTANKVPRPVRLTNNLPFDSVRTAGVANTLEIPFVTEAVSKYYSHLPGMCPAITYDYINGFIYIDFKNNAAFKHIKSIIIESAFERPDLIDEEYYEKQTDGTLQDIKYRTNDDDEFLIPEDMINTIKKLTMETFNAQITRQTNEIPTVNLMK